MWWFDVRDARLWSGQPWRLTPTQISGSFDLNSSDLDALPVALYHKNCSQCASCVNVRRVDRIVSSQVFRECGLPKSRNTTGLSQFGGLGGADSSILDPSYLESYPAPESRSKRSAKHSKSRQVRVTLCCTHSWYDFADLFWTYFLSFVFWRANQTSAQKRTYSFKSGQYKSSRLLLEKPTHDGHLGKLFPVPAALNNWRGKPEYCCCSASYRFTMLVSFWFAGNRQLSHFNDGLFGRLSLDRIPTVIYA